MPPRVKSFVAISAHDLIGEVCQVAHTLTSLVMLPSHANFILVKVGDGNAVFQKMLDKGIIVRAMAEYKLPDWVRISIGTMEQNRRCVARLKEVLGPEL